MHADVETDLVGELDRADRHAEILRRRIDGLALDALVEQHHGFEQIGRERAVHQEAGRALDRRRQPVDAPEKSARGRAGPRAPPGRG